MSDVTHPSAPLPPGKAIQLLADFVDILLPGDEHWPSAATVGVQALLAERLFEDLEDGYFDRLAKALVDAGGPFTGKSDAERVAVVQRLQDDQPALFSQIRDETYIAYYESPFVGAAIEASGQPYNMRPQIKGYALAPFDAATQTPRHGRGSYLPPDGVRPVDISALNLGDASDQPWGLKR